MHFAITPEKLCPCNGVELVWRFWNAACVEVGARSICFRVGIIGRVAQCRTTILCVCHVSVKCGKCRKWSVPWMSTKRVAVECRVKLGDYSRDRGCAGRRTREHCALSAMLTVSFSAQFE